MENVSPLLAVTSSAASEHCVAASATEHAIAVAVPFLNSVAVKLAPVPGAVLALKYSLLNTPSVGIFWYELLCVLFELPDPFRCQKTVENVLCTAAPLVFPIKGTVPPNVEIINAVRYVELFAPPLSVAWIVKRSPAAIAAVFVVSLHEVFVPVIVQVIAVLAAFFLMVYVSDLPVPGAESTSIKRLLASPASETTW
jgi:hypothetical protein